jgi:hypothetical protein
VRLTDAGAAVLDAPPPALACLIDAGLAHPVPARAEHAAATVVVPVRDRPAELDRCLAAAGAADVLVVDDGSRDQGAIAEVCERHGARVLRRTASGGPAAARNHAIAHVRTELVAFLDSDCVAPADWVRDLAGHFADPRVAAVAPRVLDPALDMGVSPAAVAPGARVAYLPGSALLVRRARSAASTGAARGQDVDLVWRHDRAGNRYDPRVVVAHASRGDDARGGARRDARGARRPAPRSTATCWSAFHYGVGGAARPAPPRSRRSRSRRADAILVWLRRQAQNRRRRAGRPDRAARAPAPRAPAAARLAPVLTGGGARPGGHRRRPPRLPRRSARGAIRHRTVAPDAAVELAWPAAIRSAPRDDAEQAPEGLDRMPHPV